MSTKEWQVAAGSSTAHVIDTTSPRPKRSGPKSACGKRPQRLNDWWFALPIDDPGALGALRSCGVTICADCGDAIAGEVTR